ncbi:MAG: DUF1631 family protein [Tepidimonas taiwanensis]|nr:DUF1631 family protein [Tepidimonas taiwanensis]
MTDRTACPSPAAPPRPSAYAELLGACRERYVAFIGGVLERAVAQIDATLQARRRATEALGESLSLLEAQYQLRAMARGLHDKFRQHFEDSFRRRTAPAPTPESAGTEPCLLPDFGLPAPQDIEVSPEALQLSAPLIEATAAELAELRPRVAWLTGHRNLDERLDPLGPVAICEAVLGVCSELAGAAENRALIKQMLIDALQSALPALFAGTNAQLAAHNIPPRPVDRRPSDREPPSGDRPQPAAATLDCRSAGTLQQALAATTAEATRLTLDGREFALRHDPQALENLLRSLQAAGIDERLAEDERTIVDVLAALFDHLFGSPSIPRPIKTLLARLQLPVLRLALADHAFFADRQHPARRLLNLLALAGATWDGEITPDSALYRQATALIAEIKRHAAQDPGVFARTSQTLADWLAEQERLTDERAATLTDQLLQREREQLAVHQAEALITPIRADVSLPESLRQFAGTTWLQVLIHAHSEGGIDGAAWREASAVLQDLVWSVRPKYDPAERARLARLLKPMLATLRDRMNRAGIDPVTRDAFFAELVKLHAAAVKAGMAGPPARQVAYRGDDAEPEAMPAGEFEVDLLGRGDWVDMHEHDGSVRRLRLTWISPARTRYLFANRQGQRAVALTRDELARRFSTGEASTVGQDALPGGIVDEVLDRHGNAS